VPSRFDVAGALSRFADRTDAWRFIGEFAASWVTPIGDADGVAEAELDAAEERLGIRLPAAVREGYRLFGRRTDLTSGNGTLWPPDEFEYDADNAVVVFRAAHQNVAYFGVSVADLGQADPPTLMYQTLADKAAESWTPFLDRFSLCCVDMVLWESVEAGERSDGRDQTAGEPASLVEGLVELPFPRYPGDVAASRWYAGGDIILREDAGLWVAVSARTDEALDAFRQAHPGDWVNE
jgi:hypothetical protein